MNIVPNFIYRRIAHRSNLIKIVENIGWLFFDKILRMGVGLLVGVWVARYLGPEQFGLLSFATAFTGFFGAIAALGLQSTVVRDIVLDPDTTDVTLGTAAILQFIGGLIAYLLILCSIVYMRPEDALARTIVAILGSMMLLKASDIAQYWFESQVQSKYVVWVQNGTFLFFAVIKVALIRNEFSLIAFVWAMLAEAVIVAGVLLAVMSKRCTILSTLSFTTVRAKTLLRDSWPLIASALAVSIYMKMDQVMLGQMIGDEAVGLYSAAARVSEIWYFVPMTIVTSLFPMLANTYKLSKQNFFSRLQHLYGWLVKSAVCLAFLITLIAENLVVAVFGDAYRNSAPILCWHIWGSVFVFFGIAWSKWIILAGLQKTATSMHLMSLASNFILNLIFIPMYGAVGAAAATAISYALGHTFFMLFFPSQRIAVRMFWRSFYTF